MPERIPEKGLHPSPVSSTASQRKMAVPAFRAEVRLLRYALSLSPTTTNNLGAEQREGREPGRRGRRTAAWAPSLERRRRLPANITGAWRSRRRSGPRPRGPAADPVAAGVGRRGRRAEREPATERDGGARRRRTPRRPRPAAERAGSGGAQGGDSNRLSPRRCPSVREAGPNGGGGRRWRPWTAGSRAGARRDGPGPRRGLGVRGGPGPGLGLGGGRGRSRPQPRRRRARLRAPSPSGGCPSQSVGGARRLAPTLAHAEAGGGSG